MRDLLVSVGVGVAAVAVLILGMYKGSMETHWHWQTKIHNAAATHEEIIIDGNRYSVYRSLEPKELQAHRSEYARRCQAITGRFFEEEYR